MAAEQCGCTGHMRDERGSGRLDHMYGDDEAPSQVLFILSSVRPLECKPCEIEHKKSPSGRPKLERRNPFLLRAWPANIPFLDMSVQLPR